MAWIQITEDDFLTAMSGKELAGLRAAALQAGQDDPLEASIPMVTNLIRAYVAGCDRNQLGDGATIPDECLPWALDLLVARTVNRVSAELSEARAEAVKAANASLLKVAEGKIYIQQPDTASPEDPKPPRPTISAPRRRMTRESQDGI